MRWVSCCVLLVISLTAEANSIDRAKVKKVFADHRRDFQSCYEVALKQDPTASGRAVWKVTWGESGRVTKVEVTEAAKSVEPAAKCVAARMHLWKFPSTPSPVTVVWPTVFEPADAGT